MEKLFTRDGNLIKLEGITANQNLFCCIEIDKLLAGEMVFHCSVDNILYQLSKDEIHVAKMMSNDSLFQIKPCVRMAQ